MVEEEEKEKKEKEKIEDRAKIIVIYTNTNYTKDFYIIISPYKLKKRNEDYLPKVTKTREFSGSSININGRVAEL